MFVVLLFGASNLLFAEEAGPPQDLIQPLGHNSYYGQNGMSVTSTERGKADISDNYPLFIAEGVPKNTALFPCRIHYLGSGGAIYHEDYYFFQDPFGVWKYVGPEKPSGRADNR